MWIEGNINPAVSWENGDVFEHRRRTVVMDDRRRRSPLLRWIIEWMGCPANESWLFWTSRERERANIEKKKNQHQRRSNGDINQMEMQTAHRAMNMNEEEPEEEAQWRRYLAASIDYEIKTSETKEQRTANRPPGGVQRSAPPWGGRPRRLQ